MKNSLETFDLILYTLYQNSQNTARLEDIDNLLDAVKQMAGKLMPMAIPKTAAGCSGMGQIQRAIHMLTEAKVEFDNIKRRIEEGLE